MSHTAIIILNWNGKAYLQQFLPQLVEHSRLPGVELVVADNGSTDGSVAFLKTAFPSVRLLVYDRNYGFTGGYNRAIAETEADYILLLNSDVEVTEGWLQPMIRMMDEDPEMAACMPRILSWHRREHFEYAGAAGGFIDRLGYPFCRGRILGHIEANHGQYSDERELFWATGACMMVRRDLFLEAGGFDEIFFAHMEEIDLCWRMKNMGKRILFCPGSTVYHVGGGTLPNEHPYKLYLNFRNNLYTLYKNLPPGQRRKIMPARFFLDLIAALKYLLSGKPSGSLAILHAYGGFLKNRKICRENRKAWLELYPLGEHHEIYRGSILFEYFFKKRKTFTQLNFPAN